MLIKFLVIIFAFLTSPLLGASGPYTFEQVLGSGPLQFGLYHKDGVYEENPKQTPAHFFVDNDQLIMTVWIGGTFYVIPITPAMKANLRFIVEAASVEEGVAVELAEDDGTVRAAEVDRLVLKIDPNNPGQAGLHLELKYYVYRGTQIHRQSRAVALDGAPLKEFDPVPSSELKPGEQYAVEVAPGSFLPVRLLGYTFGARTFLSPVIVDASMVDDSGVLSRNATLHRLNYTSQLVRVAQADEGSAMMAFPGEEWETFIAKKDAIYLDFNHLTESDIAEALFLVRNKTRGIPVRIFHGEEINLNNARIGIAILAEDLINGQAIVVENATLRSSWLKDSQPILPRGDLFYLPPEEADKIAKVAASDMITLMHDGARQLVRRRFIEVYLDEPEPISYQGWAPPLTIRRMAVSFEANIGAGIEYGRGHWEVVEKPMPLDLMIMPDQNFALYTELGIVPVVVLAVAPQEKRNMDVLVVGRYEFESSDTGRAYWVRSGQLLSLSDDPTLAIHNHIKLERLIDRSRSNGVINFIRPLDGLSQSKFEFAISQAQQLIKNEEQRNARARFRASVVNSFNSRYLDWRSKDWRIRSLFANCVNAFSSATKTKYAQ